MYMYMVTCKNLGAKNKEEVNSQCCFLHIYIYRAHSRAHRSEINSPGVYIYRAHTPGA